MKKTVVFLLAALMVFVSAIGVCAAPSEFVDEIEDGFPKAYSWSPKMYYEFNRDTEHTILVKQDDNGNPLTSEYIVYKMDKEITGFSLDCMHVNGLGNGETDVKVYVGKNDKDWTQVPVKATEFTYDDEIYINQDKAYWLLSTVSNKEAIPAGNTFIKIELTEFTKKASCVWNTVIDTVKIQMGGAAPAKPTDAPAKPTDTPAAPTDAPAEETTAAPDAAETTADTAETTEAAPAVTEDNSNGPAATTAATAAPADAPEESSGGMNVGIIVVCCVVGAAAIGGIIYAIVRAAKH